MIPVVVDPAHPWHSFEAADWAEAFRADAAAKGYPDIDPNWAFDWFFSALMRGYFKGKGLKA